ncbi:hypothetical protein L3X38_007959 [Prunus dulcis]|uniref:Uncharacterized protein n=1 Tax=Prunus dulcis TaxID=3755 RepID=A0AAD4ZVP5_PRUDU|nr:hypothetical protein L3X38_007959 [Prunus dulcis]
MGQTSTFTASGFSTPPPPPPSTTGLETDPVRTATLLLSFPDQSQPSPSTVLAEICQKPPSSRSNFTASFRPFLPPFPASEPARFCSWELTEQPPRVVTHPGIALASNSLNFGVLTTPKPVSSQKASRYEDARVVTHPGIALASNSLNFGVLTTPKPVSSQKASRYEDARCAI